KIIYEQTKEKPKLLFDGNKIKQYELVEEIFVKLLEERKYQELYIDFIAYHLEQEVEEETFEDKEEYFKYLRNMRYTTLNNQSVKSIAERDIANFLFMNNVKFEYEPLVDWVDDSKEDKEYHPDFYLPKYDIYIEHWGLNKELEVPPWFSITSKEYKNLRKWKLSQFKKHKKILVETWDYEKSNNELIPKLKEKLLESNPKIEFTPLSYEELIKKTSEFMDKRDEIINLVASFIKIAKSNFFTVEDIAKRIKSKKYSTKQKLFGQIAVEVYKKYQDFLKKENKIDFNDMINLAAQIIKKNPEKYLNTYDHILVDEFQDISYQRMELINSFVNENSNTKLFCVGDDWQSIYRFNGSNVTFFVNFRDFFPNPELSYLNRNYRSSPQIVDTSSKLISYNKNQIEKKIYSTNPNCPKPILFVFSEKLTHLQKIQPPYIHKLIEALLNEKVKPEEITVISRFNKNLKDIEVYCGARGIQIEEYAGKLRPGVRFYSAHKSKGSESTHVIITDLTSGIYGFPCEIQDSSVFELARRFEKKRFIEEERRLFYVAFTRSKKFLYLFSIENNYSMFLNEIGPYIDRVYVDSFDNWIQILSNFVIPTINGKLGESELPVLCPDCGRLLKEREGKYGKFLGCTGYPQCRFTFNLKDKDAISCPRCGNMLVVRKGRYGMFLGCMNYPQCNFTFNLERPSKDYIYCPKCRRRLVVRSEKYGRFIGCTGYPECKFTFNIEKNITNC
ncbi:MAG: topoisomerase DNA-binding C4 zinc finger domain-containing protein, partial [Promethearchaeota archaeon]